ncbi:hypothetical protein J7E45_16045 [Microbacterium sp. ISL-59]|uniref:hypothetical protein n=1 Tax=Microbacterium sp. ISL-59 TaxID=2819159 RepID=UPI001BEAE879|nr:hypothetical protein [Microbacterium sp. ISL-59]MBT2497124.1 hypothetical protein [Microbacterium sp. ISL-59]
MDKNGLTPSQEEYFRTLELLDSDGQLRDNIADAKESLRRDNVVRGFVRVKGFRPNGQ